MQESTPSRRTTRRALVAGSVIGGLTLAGRAAPAEAAPATDTWKLGGNTSVNADGTNYLGVRNVAPLIFKTASVAGSPVERMRIAPAGAVTVKNAMAVGGAVVAGVRLFATTAAVDGVAVRGTGVNSISTALNAVGVDGVATVGVRGNGEYMGVNGSSLNYGVFGFTTPDTGGTGIYGRGGTGVKGRSYTGSAVLGDTDTGVAVKGEAYGDGGFVKAVHGQVFGADGTGVLGEANNGASAFGVWGISSTGLAGVFSGKVTVTGLLSKGGGSFKIDHPLDPANRYLYHSFVESPDMMNVYNGTVTTDAAGRATVTLPDWFEALNRDFRYQLTTIGSFSRAMVSREVHGNAFEVRTEDPHVTVSWQLTGIRHDAFAQANRIPVEEVKPHGERGRFLHPAAHGQPASAGIAVSPEAAARPSAGAPRRRFEPGDARA